MTENEPLEAEFVAENEPQSGLAVAGNVLPTTLHLLPVFDRPFFPAQAVPIVMDESPWLQTIEAIGETAHHMAGLVMIKTDRLDQLTPGDFHAIGSVVRLHHPGRSSGKLQFIAEGLQRFRIVKWLSQEPPYLVRWNTRAKKKRPTRKRCAPMPWRSSIR